jgi:hypothetical protein
MRGSDSFWLSCRRKVYEDGVSCLTVQQGVPSARLRCSIQVSAHQHRRSHPSRADVPPASASATFRTRGASTFAETGAYSAVGGMNQLRMQTGRAL